MKKNLLFIFLIIAVSCNISDIENNLGVAPIFIAEQETQHKIKSSIEVDNEGYGTIYWSPADNINIFFGTQGVKYTSTNTERATTATFETTSFIGSTESVNEYWALYPYDKDATCDKESVFTALPDTQFGVAETFDDDLFISLAKSDTKTLRFYNVCGGIKFSLSRNDIRKISFSGNNKEPIAGNIKLTYKDGVPCSCVIENKEATSISLFPKEGDTFAANTNYYIVLLPVVFSSGFKITFETETHIGTFEYSNNSVEIKRATFSKKANIDTYATFERKQANNSIIYTTTDGKPLSGISASAFGSTLTSNTYQNGEGELVFNKDIVNIGEYAINNNNVSSISLPKSVESVAPNAFCSTNLKKFSGKFASADGRCLIVNEKLVSFAPRGLTEYHTPKGVSTIGTYAFHNTPSTAKIYLHISDGVVAIEARAFYHCRGITLPSTLIEIAEYGLSYIDSNSIIIPEHVSSMGAEAFMYILDIKSALPPTITGTPSSSNNPIFVPEGKGNAYKSAWSALSSRIFEKGEQPLNEIWYTTTDGKPAKANRSNPNITPSWKESMISNANGKMVFDDALTMIPYDAFENSNLVSISFPDAVTYIGENSFQLSAGLREVKFGTCLNEIGYYAFAECPIEDIILPGNVENLNYSFVNCKSLKSVTLPEELVKLGSRLYNQGSQMTGGGVFMGCSSLKSITLPQSLEYIGTNCFAGTGITEIIIPENVEYIGMNCFAGTGITEIIIPENVQQISESAFMDCSDLQSVILPQNITEISSSLFKNCSSLTELTIPKNVNKLDAFCLDGCVKLNTIHACPNIAPKLSSYVSFPKSGTLFYPKGANYSEWLLKMTGWNVIEE